MNSGHFPYQSTSSQSTVFNQPLKFLHYCNLSNLNFFAHSYIYSISERPNHIILYVLFVEKNPFTQKKISNRETRDI